MNDHEMDSTSRTSRVPRSPRLSRPAGFAALVTWLLLVSCADSWSRAHEMRLSGSDFAEIIERQAGVPDDSAFAAATKEFRLRLERSSRGDRVQRETAAAGWSVLAERLDERGSWREAADAQMRAVLLLSQARGERDPAVASARAYLAVLEYELGRYSLAEREIDLALAVLLEQEPVAPGDLADALNTRAELHRVRDRYPEAESTFLRAIALADSAPEAARTTLAQALNNLAGIYRDQARFGDAEPLLRRSLFLRLADQPPDARSVSIGFLNLAEILRMQGRGDEADSLYARAVGVAADGLASGDPLLALIRTQYGVHFEQLGHIAKADSLFRLSLATLEKTLPHQHPGVTEVQLALARTAWSANRQGEADSLLGAALEARRSTYGSGHPEVGLVLLQLAELHSTRANHFENSAPLEVEGAIACLARSPAYKEPLAGALAILARARHRSGDVARAIATMDSAIRLHETLRAVRGGGEDVRAHFMAKRIQAYHDLASWQLDLGDLEGALQTMERGRARSLRDRMTEVEADPVGLLAGRVRDSVESRVRELRGSLADRQWRIRAAWESDSAWTPAGRASVGVLERSRDSLVWLLERTMENAAAMQPERGQRLASVEDPTLDRIQRELLHPNRIAVAYQIGERRSFVIALGPSGDTCFAESLVIPADIAARWKTVPGPLTSGELDRRVHGGREPEAIGLLGVLRNHSDQRPASKRPLDRALRELLSDLGRVLLPERIRRLALNRNAVVVVPEGAMVGLPLDALVVDDSRAEPVYWLDEGAAVSVAPSLSSLLAARRADARRPHGQMLLSVADPDFQTGVEPRGDNAAGTPSGLDGPRTRGGWTPLSSTREENHSFCAAFAPDSVLSLLGPAATEGNVRRYLSHSRIVHLATHGFVAESKSALLAGLVFTAPSRPTSTDDDGLLQAFELNAIPLRCEVLVLSACETDVGRALPAEGAFTLARRFLGAGSAQVVSTLWRVGDVITAEVMGAFFSSLAESKRRDGTLDAVRSLAHAKRSLRTRSGFAHPYYWAGVNILGLPVQDTGCE